MKFRGGEFPTGTTGNFQPELTVRHPRLYVILRTRFVSRRSDTMLDGARARKPK